MRFIPTSFTVLSLSLRANLTKILIPVNVSISAAPLNHALYCPSNECLRDNTYFQMKIRNVREFYLGHDPDADIVGWTGEVLGGT